LLSLMYWWTIFHCPTQLRHTEWNEPKENSSANILVASGAGCTEGLTRRKWKVLSLMCCGDLPVCHLTQTHCFKNYRFWNGVFEWFNLYATAFKSNFLCLGYDILPSRPFKFLHMG
jgi:hypothetical protein